MSTQETNNSGSPFDFASTPGYDIGFFECFKDPLLCLGSYFAPCLITGLVQGQIDKKGFNVWSCLCTGIGAYRIRRHVQGKAGIVESEDASMCAIGCCGCCGLVQDSHELFKRKEICGLTSCSSSEPAATAAPAKEGDVEAQK